MTTSRARQLLGVGLTAGAEQIDAAFRSRAWAVHPDRGGDGRAFAELVEARSVLHAALSDARGRRPAPTAVVSDGELLRRAIESTIRRWLRRYGPGRRLS